MEISMESCDKREKKKFESQFHIIECGCQLNSFQLLLTDCVIWTFEFVKIQQNPSPRADLLFYYPAFNAQIVCATILHFCWLCACIF